MNVIKTIKRSSLAAGVGMTMFAGAATRAFAENSGTTVAGNGSNSINPGFSTDLYANIKNIINVLIVLIGIVAVIMLIVGGFRYVFSQGNEKAVTGAKDTILYAIIGIVVAILAFAIINFVLTGLNTGTPA